MKVMYLYGVMPTVLHMQGVNFSIHPLPRTATDKTEPISIKLHRNQSKKGAKRTALLSHTSQLYPCKATTLKLTIQYRSSHTHITHPCSVC
jgi:hypothetical protein